MQIGSERVFATRENMDLEKIKGYQNTKYQGMESKKVKEVSQEFESLFINQLFKSMRNTVPKNDWLGGGMRKDIFEDMLYTEYSKNISKAGGIGLGDMVYRSLMKSGK